MSEFDGFFSSSGSMFDAREDLQYKLNDPRIPQYEKDEMIRQHNWKYCDNMSSDTVQNQMRYNLSSPYYDHSDSSHKSHCVTNSREYDRPLTVAELRRYIAPSDPEEKERNIFTDLADVAGCIIVRRVDSVSAKRAGNEAWIINRLNYMFCSLMEHKDESPRCVDEVEKLVGKSVGLDEVFDKLRRNYINKASYLFLPGAMLIVLEKFKGAQKTESYRNTEKLYLRYMDAIINNIYNGRDHEYLRTKRGKDYYFFKKYDESSYITADFSFLKTDNRTQRKITAVEMFGPYTEKQQLHIKNNLTGFISSWCDPLSFYELKGMGISPEGTDYRTGPKSIGDRYGFFGYKLLENGVDESFLAYCAEMGGRADPGFFRRSEKNKAVVMNVMKNIGVNFAYPGTLTDFLELFKGEEEITRGYVEFCSKWIKDNLADYEETFFDIHKKRGVKPDLNAHTESLKKIKAELIDKNIEDLKLRASEFPGELMKRTLDTAINDINSHYSVTYRRIEKYVTEYYSKRYWVPNKKCRHCGGEFRGVLKKVCTACGKEKDY